MQGFTEGRIAHYVMKNGEHRPAIIVNAWELSGVCDGYANLTVFSDWNNDDESNGIFWVTSKCHSDNKEPDTWHWIEQA